MDVLNVDAVSLSFGGLPLLDGVTLHVERGERIGLLGRNGSGKSTFLKIIQGDMSPDAGRIAVKEGIRTSLLPQDVPESLPGTVYDVVSQGGSGRLDLLREYHDLTMLISQKHNETLLKRLEDIQHRLDATDSWSFHQRIRATLEKTSLDGNAQFHDLSAGKKRLAFLARALVNDPDIFLLDEPTNHLDIDTILWLENLLLALDAAVIFVTHDRSFLQSLATRIVEIDRGSLLSFSCDYPSYLEQRQAMAEAEEKQRLDFDKKLDREEAWIRQGVKARRTRNEGRVNALLTMRRERASRRDRAGNARIGIQEAEKSGRLVAEVDRISFSYGEKPIVHSFSTTIMRGDKVGIIGPNGSGKTTLLRLLLGVLKPSSGSVRIGTRIKIAYFDQLRSRLSEEKTLRDNVCEGSDHVFVNGAPRHVAGYLQDFLFAREQIMSPVKTLSGGEKNRLLLAKLFSMPSNVLVLDEPTNDLDAETLELLEAKLVEYTGTVLMVSHDRTFLNNVVTSTIVFENGPCPAEYVGGYDDWLMQRVVNEKARGQAVAEGEARKAKPVREKIRLSYREARELEEAPLKIEALEDERKRLFDLLNSPDFQTQRDRGALVSASERLEEVEREISDAYSRWAELEDLAERLGK